MKIAILAPSFLPKFSGAEIFHHNLATRLSLCGEEVVVVLMGTAWRQWRGAGISPRYAVEAFPSLPARLFKRWPSAAGWLAGRELDALQKKYSFDVWHAFCAWPAGIFWAGWAERSGVPGIFRPVGDDVLPVGGATDRKRGGPLSNEVRRLVRTAPAIAALSVSMKLGLGAAGTPDGRLVIMPNAVDLPYIDALASEMPRNSAGPPLLLSVGRNHPQKDYPTLIRAYQMLKAKGIVFRAAILGRDASGLESALKSAGLDDIVECGEIVPGPARDPGRQPPPELVSWYRRATLFVMPSVIEGFSTAMLEAAACGLPIVTTDGPGCADFVRGGRDGRIVPVGNPEALEAVLCELLSDPEERHSLALAARRRVEEFSWDNLVARYLAVYRNLMFGRHPGDGVPGFSE